MTRTTTGVVLAVAAIAMASGASAQQRGVTATEVTFGMPTDLSGVAATYGVSSSNAVKMRFEEVNDLIWSEIERVNANFARVETIKKFRLIEQQLTAEDEEVTPTMKLKRKFVSEKYKAMIDGMYAEAS